MSLIKAKNTTEKRKSSWRQLCRHIIGGTAGSCFDNLLSPVTTNYTDDQELSQAGPRVVVVVKIGIWTHKIQPAFWK